MKLPLRKSLYVLAPILAVVLNWQAAHANVLDENCVVNVLNRTVQVNKDGGWSMPNVPSFMGRIRARATCTKLGETFSGQSEYFNIVRNGAVVAPQIQFGDISPTPVKLQVSEPGIETLADGATAQLKVLATYRDGTTLDVTPSDQGSNYTSSNPAIASVNADGLVTGVASGNAVRCANCRMR